MKEKRLIALILDPNSHELKSKHVVLLINDGYEQNVTF